MSRAREHYAFYEHTADLGVEAWGPDIKTVYEALAIALMDGVTNAARVMLLERKQFSVSADDERLLLQRFLQEALCTFEIHGFVFGSVDVELGAHEVRAELSGESFDPRRHGRGHEIKAVTHHGLELESTKQGVRARVLLDI